MSNNLLALVLHNSTQLVTQCYL